MILSWTEEEHKLLAELLDEGKNIREIENSGHFDYNYSKIWNYAKKHSLETNTYNRKCIRCNKSVGGRASHTEYCFDCVEVRKKEYHIENYVPKKVHKVDPTIWTKEELDKLAKLNERGFTYKEIGEKIGRTESAVISRIYILGISNRDVQEKEIAGRRESVKAMVENGFFMKDIAKELNVNYSVVVSDVSSMGLKPRNGREGVFYEVTCVTCKVDFRSRGAGAMYCRECRRKRNNKRDIARNEKRLKRMKKNGSIDYSINIDDLHERDGGVCYLCGGMCSFDDHYSNDKANFIVGRTHPSIDHVLPVAKGGTHTWDNVKLAHHFCNSQKNMSTTNGELYPIPTPSNSNLVDA